MVDQQAHLSNSRGGVIAVQAIRVCHVVASINEHTGGPAVSVPAICRALKSHDVDPTLFCLNYPGAGPQLRPEGVNIVSIEADALAVRLRGYSRVGRSKLVNLAGRGGIDILHNHGLWMFPNVDARVAASRASIPLINSPRGMLEQWSMRNSAFKKRLAWNLYERANLQAAAAFHATSLAEVESIRRAGFAQPIAMIPNGVELPNLPIKRELMETKFPLLRDRKWLLFMSRLHPKKGIDLLLKCWGELRSQHQDCTLVVAGADAPGHEGEFQRLAHQLGLDDQVLFTGNLSGELKSAALHHAELFVLPTHSENFGIVVAESLAHETPVITTHGTPWESLNQALCGWWIPNSFESLKDTLDNALRLHTDERREMGRRGRDLVATQFSWDIAGRQMAEFYRWILGGGERPHFVHA